jgi:putative oxidoreductase
MKIVSMIARIFLGLIFLVFGLNHFHNFIPMGPVPSGAMGQFFGILMSTGMMYFVAGLEVVGAILLLINRYVPLGLTLLAPIIVNILLVQALMQPSGLPIGGVVTILWLLTFSRVRSAFAGLFQQRVEA